jgi:hypothetical protein
VIISARYLLVRCLLGCLKVLAQQRVPKDAELLVLRHENERCRKDQTFADRIGPGSSPSGTRRGRGTGLLRPRFR